MKRKWWIVSTLVFVELLVCGGILLTLWTGRSTFEGVRFFYVADTHIEETVEESFAVDGPAVLDLENDFGDVIVTGSNGDEVEVIARLSLWGTDEQDARQTAQVRMTREGDRITIRVERPEHIYALALRAKGSRVDFEIKVPAETSLQLATSSGDLEVSDVTGVLELDTSFGSVQVEDVRGTVRAQSDSGNITVTGLRDGGKVQVETNFGELLLRDISANSLVAHSDSGSIQMEDGALDGSLDLSTNFGDVTVAGVDAASYRLHSDSGGLTLDGCGGPLDLGTEFGDIEVTNATEAELMLSTNSGAVFFSGSLRARGEHRAKSDFGDVHLVLPADTAFDLNAQTDFGSINTDFSVTVAEFEERRLVGAVNGGGSSLWLETNSGNITLESKLN